MHAIAKHMVEFTGADGKLAVAKAKQRIVLSDQDEFERLKTLGAIIPTTKKDAEEAGASKPTPAGLLTEATADEQQTASEPAAKKTGK